MCRFSDFLDEIWNLYDDEDTNGHAMSTGWKDVDRYYRVRLLHAALVSILKKTRLSHGLLLICTLPDNSQTKTSTPQQYVNIAALQVVPGELSIVTGVPNSGKSEWIDALICNLAMHHGWSFALCSMEKKVCHIPHDVTFPSPRCPLLGCFWQEHCTKGTVARTCSGKLLLL